MLFFKLFLAIGSLAALIFTYKTNSRPTNLIVLGMIGAIILVQFPATLISGIYIYMVFVLFAFLYGIFMSGKTLRARLIICLMSVTMLSYWLWIMNHWHGNTSLFPPFALLVGVTGFFFRDEIKKEWGFLLVLGVDALDSVIEILF